MGSQFFPQPSLQPLPLPPPILSLSRPLLFPCLMLPSNRKPKNQLPPLSQPLNLSMDGSPMKVFHVMDFQVLLHPLVSLILLDSVRTWSLMGSRDSVRPKSFMDVLL